MIPFKKLQSQQEYAVYFTLAILGGLAYAFFACANSAAFIGHFNDPDDYLYLAQSLDWLRGQHWYDLNMARENPPTGTYIHYSRFLSSFYGLLTLLLARIAELDLIHAAIVMAIFLPMVFFGLLLVALYWSAIPLLKNYSWLAVVLALCAPSILADFIPGHIDHHGLELILAILSCGCMARFVSQPRTTRWAYLTALVLVFGVVVSLEFLPVLLISAGSIGLWSLKQNGKTVRTSTVFGYALLGFNIFFLGLTKPFGTILKPDILNYSIVYVMLAAAIALCFLVVELASGITKSLSKRFVVGFIVAIIFAIIFVCLYPEFRNGPLGALSPVMADFTYKYISEAVPVLNFKENPDAYFVLSKITVLLRPLLGVGAGLYLVFRSKEEIRWVWGMLLLLVTATAGMAAFSQVRFLGYAELFSLIPLAALFEIQFDLIWKLRHKRDFTGLAFRGLLVGFLILASIARLGANGWHIQQPYDAQNNCDLEKFSTFLNRPDRFESKSLTIMAGVDIGAELLFRTQHKVVAVSDFSDVEGLNDYMKFFGTADPHEAENVAQRHGVDLVAICPLKNFYISPFIRNGRVVTDSPGKQVLTFAQQLQNGQIPAWLSAIKSPEVQASRMILFSVNK